MPITSSAKKALRGSKKKRVFNLRRKNEMQSVIKEYKKLVLAKKKQKRPKTHSQTSKSHRQGRQEGGVIKKNTASRKKSRLLKTITRSKI